MTIHLLTRECWPSLNVNTIILPSVVKTQIDIFTTYYTNTFKNRILQFNLPYSFAEIEYKLCSKVYLLQMNTIQTNIIINIFNKIKFNQTTLDEIYNTTKGNRDDLKISLNGLINVKLLLKTEEENYRLNPGFTIIQKGLRLSTHRKLRRL
jgi:hypothetical protein